MHHPKARRRHKSFLNRFLWRVTPKLPSLIRQRLVRNFFSVPKDIPAAITFKRAETFDEIEQAFALVHEAYVDQGLMREHPSQMRITKYHLLPTTWILVGKCNDEVIATLTVVADSSLGLPVDALWDITDLRRDAVRIAEISSLTIKKSYRAQRGHLLLPLYKFMYNLARSHLGVNMLVAVTHPKIGFFYQDLLLFKKLKGHRVKAYDQVENNLAACYWLDMDKGEGQGQKIYEGRPPEKDLYRFFLDTEVPNFRFPDTSHGIESASHSPAMLEYFFKHQVDLISRLSNEEKIKLANVYFFSSYHSILDVDPVRHGILSRRQPRFTVLCNACVIKDAAIFPATVLEVSRNGMMIRLGPDHMHLKRGNELRMKVELGPNTHLSVKARLAWMDPVLLRAGLVLGADIPVVWREFIETLEISAYKRSVNDRRN
jgi:hypothetical protein